MSDKLVVHGNENKSEELKKGIQKISQLVYKPSLVLTIGRGHLQTLMGIPKEMAVKRKEFRIKYHQREVFRLSDGGSVAVEYMGDTFLN